MHQHTCGCLGCLGCGNVHVGHSHNKTDEVIGAAINYPGNSNHTCVLVHLYNVLQNKRINNAMIKYSLFAFQHKNRAHI